MTNSEAIQILEDYIESIGAEVIPTKEDSEAFNLAIKALKIQTRLKLNNNELKKKVAHYKYVLKKSETNLHKSKGTWIMNKTSARGRNYTCTNCEKISRNKFDYCPKCGAKMQKGNSK